MSSKNNIEPIHHHHKIRSQNFMTNLDERKDNRDRKDFNLFEIETLNFKLYYKTEMNNKEFIKNALQQVENTIKFCYF